MKRRFSVGPRMRAGCGCKHGKRLSKPVMEELFGEWKKTLLVYVPVIVLLVGVLSFFVNWGATWSARNALLDRDAVRRDALTESRVLLDNATRVQGLEAEIKRLSDEIARIRATVPPVPAPVPASPRPAAASPVPAAGRGGARP